MSANCTTYYLSVQALASQLPAAVIPPLRPLKAQLHASDPTETTVLRGRVVQAGARIE